MFEAKGLYRTATDLETRVTTAGKYFVLHEPNPLDIQRLLEPLNGKSMLDAGCGIGTSLLPFGPQLGDYPNMIGLDSSAAVIRRAQQRRYAAQLPPLDLIHGDVQNLPFSDEYFDLVMARHMLYHVDDIPRAISEMKRVLKVGGLLLATTNSEKSRPELTAIHLESLNNFPKAVAVPRGSSRFSLENGESLIRKEFDNVQVIPWSGEYQYTDVTAPMNYYASTPYFQKALDDPYLRQKLYNLVASKIQTIIDREGVFTVRGWGAIFLSRKSA